MTSLSSSRRWAPWALGLTTTLLLVSCGSVPKIPAAGIFHGEAIETTVDSEVARYYLESYLQGKRTDAILDRRIDALAQHPVKSHPSREELATISKDFSVDFAALYFADRLLGTECNRLINRKFAAYRARPRLNSVDVAPYLALFVPGWDHVANGSITGADFARPRKLATALGLESYLVPLPATGSVEANSAVVAQEISRHAASGKKILVAGASSAGPAIHLALGELVPKKDLGSVKAWLNLGGILQGSPLVDYLEARPQVWLLDVVAWAKGWETHAISTMGTGPSRKRFQRLRIDADILVVNYLGIPLSGQVSRHAADKYPRLSADGPNDGLTLLPDAIAPQSLTVVALGSDHFFAEDPKIDEKTVALMALIVTSLRDPQVMSCR